MDGSGTGRGREEGFTLIELLVVTLIVGILASIAVPTLMRQRQKAWARAAESDLRNAAIAAEMYYEENFTYVGLDGDYFNTSSDNELIFSDGTTESYCLEADHKKLPAVRDFHFDLDLGRPAPGPC